MELRCIVFLGVCLPSEVFFDLTMYCNIVVVLYVLAGVTKIQKA